MNAVVQGTTASTAVGALKSLKAGIANVQQTLVRSSANPYLRMLRDGKWVYGQEDIEVEAGSLWAANPMSLQHGWTAWKKAKLANEKVDNSGGPVGEAMVPLSAPLPPKESLPDHMDVNAPWEYQTSIELVCLNGTDKGEQVVYKASSKGAVGAMDDLIKAIGRQLDADETKPVPVIKFETDTYDHKDWGQTYVPVLTVVDWVEFSDKMPDVADPATSAPAAPQTAAAAPAEDDELAKLEAMIVAKKLAKEKAEKEAAEKAAAKADETRPMTDEEKAAIAKAERLAALRAEMAALDGDTTQTAQPASAAPAAAGADGKPQRRRRQA